MIVQKLFILIFIEMLYDVTTGQRLRSCREGNLRSVTVGGFADEFRARLVETDGDVPVELKMTFSWEITNPAGVPIDGFLVKVSPATSTANIASPTPLNACTSGDNRLWINQSNCVDAVSSESVVCPPGVNYDEDLSCPEELNTTTPCRGSGHLLTTLGGSYVAVQSDVRMIEVIVDFHTNYVITVRPYYRLFVKISFPTFTGQADDCHVMIAKSENLTMSESIEVCCDLDVPQYAPVGLKFLDRRFDFLTSRSEVTLSWKQPVSNDEFSRFHIFVLSRGESPYSPVIGEIEELTLANDFNTTCYVPTKTYRVYISNLLLNTSYLFQLKSIYSAAIPECSPLSACSSILEFNFSECIEVHEAPLVDYGNVTSPGFPQAYSAVFNCTWIIRAPPGERVRVWFSYVNITRRQFIRIFDEDTDVLLGAISGSYGSFYSYVSSSSSGIRINYASNGNFRFRGFRAFYEVHLPGGDQRTSTCGGALPATSGLQYFSTPNWPDSYPPYVRCTWILSAGVKQIVRLRFLGISTPRTTIDFDTIQVYDGRTILRPLLFTYSRKYYRTFDDWISSGQSLTVVFASDFRNSNGGFRAAYWAIRRNNLESGCIEERMAPGVGHGEFTSPGYPQPYPAAFDCTWIVRAPPGERVRIWFSYINTTDVIKVTDAGTLNEIAAITGDMGRFYNYVSATDRGLMVNSASNGNIRRRGCRAFYELHVIGGDLATSACGGSLTATTDLQYFSTPNWPGLYPNNARCSWIISTQLGKVIQLTFLGIITYRGGTQENKIWVYDGLTTFDTLLIGYAGIYPSAVDYLISSGRYMNVVFHSDSSTNNGSFRATYREIKHHNALPVCFEEVDVPLVGHGNISSPGFPDEYGAVFNCTWILNAPQGRRVRVWFSFLKSELNFVRVYEHDSNTLLATVSKDFSRYFNYVSTGRSLRIEYSAKDNEEGAGLLAYYNTFVIGADSLTSSCGRRLYASSNLKYFSSPNWPSVYPSSSICSWRIYAPPGNVVLLAFLGVKTEGPFDTIAIFDGASTLRPRLFRYAGNYYRLRSGFISTGRYMTVSFRSDNTVNYGGFRATYKAIFPVIN